MNKEALYKVRGDLYAGAMKLHEDTLSITAQLELLVDEKDGEEIWNLTEGDSVEVGPFRVRFACEDRSVLPASTGLCNITTCDYGPCDLDASTVMDRASVHTCQFHILGPRQIWPQQVVVMITLPYIRCLPESCAD